MNPWLALASCFVGALLGDCVMYSIGYHFGHGVLRDHPWFARFLKPEREAHIEEMISQHGWKIFLAARFLVGLRSPVVPDGWHLAGAVSPIRAGRPVLRGARDLHIFRTELSLRREDHRLVPAHSQRRDGDYRTGRPPRRLALFCFSMCGIVVGWHAFASGDNCVRYGWERAEAVSERKNAG